MTQPSPRTVASWRRPTCAVTLAALLVLACGDGDSTLVDPTPDPSTSATSLVFVNPPTVAQSGEPFQVAVALKNSSGQTVDVIGRITLSLGINPSGATLSGTTTLDALGGVASFDSLTLHKVGSGYTITASANGLASATTPQFDVVPGPVAQVVTNHGAAALSFPSGIGSVQLEAEAYDAAGNVVTTPITWTSSDPNVAPVTSSGLVTAHGAGLATVSAVAGDTTGDVLVGVLCSPDRCTPSHSISYELQPRDEHLGRFVAVQTRLSKALGSGSCTELTATIALGHNPGGAALTGQTTQTTTDALGPMSWPGLKIDKLGNGYTLVVFAECGGLRAQQVSDAFNITPPL